MELKNKLLKIIPADQLRQNELMSQHTTFKIGGPADLFAEARTLEQLVGLINLAREEKIPLLLLGGGANMLVADKGVRGLVIWNRAEAIKRVDGNSVLAESGATNAKFSMFCADTGLAGAEFMLAIPGTVGATIRQNGRFRNPQSFSVYFQDFTEVKDCFVRDIVKSLEILTPDGRREMVAQDYLGTDYHQARLKETGDVVLSAIFKLREEDPKKVKDLIRILIEWRAKRAFTDPKTGNFVVRPPDPVTGNINVQPLLPSAGCVFSNITNKDNHPTGRMIDMAGLRGQKIGGAMVSPEHANYIVNTGGAKAADVVALIELIKSKVKERFDVALQEEIVLVGDFS
jgi:UDP-N-acetylmuramate dehydrogenase